MLMASFSSTKRAVQTVPYRESKDPPSEEGRFISRFRNHRRILVTQLPQPQETIYAQGTEEDQDLQTMTEEAAGPADVQA
ncbi:MAG: hypothetical protein Q9172_000878 [Xanthocarpia lactea]